MDDVIFRGCHCFYKILVKNQVNNTKAPYNNFPFVSDGGFKSGDSDKTTKGDLLGLISSPEGLSQTGQYSGVVISQCFSDKTKMSKEDVDRYKTLVANLENELKSKGGLLDISWQSIGKTFPGTS